MTCKYVNKSTHLSGPSFREVREGRTTTPPPPCDHKAKNSPQQHPPESTILHQFAAKNKNNPKGNAPRPPNLRFPLAQRQVSLFRRYFKGCPIKLIGKYPSNPKFDPPLQKFLGTGLSIYLHRHLFYYVVLVRILVQVTIYRRLWIGRGGIVRIVWLSLLNPHMLKYFLSTMETKGFLSI